MPQSERTFTIQLPVASDAFGRWLEANGAHIEISCSLGTYTVTVSWNRLHSYSDDTGTHRESWELSRHGKNLSATFGEAMAAAASIAAGGGK